MLVHVWNGAREGEDDVELLARAAIRAAESGGHQAVPWTLRDHDFTFCRQCYRCWVSTPGMCVGTYADRDVARRLADADILVLVTALTFGCYSSGMKAALDHLQPMLTSQFERWAGETHHPLRYGRFPPILAVAAGTTRDSIAEGVFATLVWRNSFTSRAPSAAAVFGPGDGVDRAVERLAAILAGLSGQPSSMWPKGHVPRPEPPNLVQPQFMDLESVGPGDEVLDPQPPAHALLLVGSPQPGLKPSTPDDHDASLALGRALARRLFARGVEGRTLFLADTVRLQYPTEQMLAAVAAAELVVLSFPLCVDSPPVPALQALELMAKARGRGANQGERRQPGFLAVCQSAMPEAEQNAVALAVCRRFADEAGFAWRGGLAVGRGPAVASRLSSRWLARSVASALDGAAAALAAGQAIPADVVRRAAQAIAPASLYRRAAERSYRRQADRNGVRRPSISRPFEPSEV